MSQQYIYKIWVRSHLSQKIYACLSKCKILSVCSLTVKDYDYNAIPIQQDKEEVVSDALSLRGQTTILPFIFTSKATAFFPSNYMAFAMITTKAFIPSRHVTRLT